MKYNPSYWEDVALSIESIPEVEDLYGKTVLITGGTGLIGSSVADQLIYLNRNNSAGMRIVIAARSEDRVWRRFEGVGPEDGVEYFHYDATSLDDVEFDGDIDYIIHAASNANPAVYMKEPVETMLSNFVGLNAMLRLAARKRVKRLLFVSSSEVYGQKESLTEPFEEDKYGFLDILNERAGYPSSKRAGETLIVAYGMEYGVDSVIVRPGHIYGPTITPADNRASAEFTRDALEGKDIVMKSKGEQLRSYCYSLDCASAMLTVLLKGEKGNAYNISNPDAICTIRAIAEMIADKGGVKVVFDLPTEAEKKSYSMMMNSALRSDKLEALGWKGKFDLEHGVECMFRAMR